MKAEAISKLLSLLGAKKIQKSGKWVKSSCVFAPWYHANGSDNTPSFGVSVAQGLSGFNCFTCQAKGPELMDMIIEIHRLNKINHYIDLDMKELLQLISLEEQEADLFEDEFPSYDDLVKPKTSDIKPFPEKWLESFPRGYQHPYLVKRGVSFSVAKHLDIRFDSTRNRVCFPIRTASGVLVGLQGRAVDSNPIRYYLYPYNGTFNPSVWLNENNVDLGDPVVIVEGAFDMAAIMMAGYMNVVGSLTSKITVGKAKRLQDATQLITFFDVGTGGNTGRMLIEQMFKSSNSVHLTPDEPYKDAGEMPPDVVKSYIEEALDYF